MIGSSDERPWPMTVKIPPALLDRLDRAARAEDVTRSGLVREMVEDGLDRLEAGGEALIVRLVEPAPALVVAPVVDLAERRGSGPALY